MAEIEADEVVLLDDQGAPIGSADRTAVHTEETPLHLAFSSYLFNSAGEVLITRRALSKKTWPGVWTNSCCGHPKPGEDPVEAIGRRVQQELGMDVRDLRPVLPDFRYRAVDASGVVENEICPVFVGHVDDQAVRPNPDEVAEFAWVGWEALRAAVAATPAVYSPWCVLQIPRLNEAGMPVGVADAELSSDEVVADVDALLVETVAELNDEWQTHTGGLGADVVPMDLPGWLEDLAVGRGKRLRIRMVHAGFVAAGGGRGHRGHADMVRVAAALESLHLFALVHDDVMDDSDSRRGRPAAHLQAEHWHEAAGAVGEAAQFGRNLAMLVGDLAHTVADRLVDDLPAGLRRRWYDLCLELIAGQRADLTGAAAGRRDRAHAEHVASTKSGRYSVVRPLQIGAAAAGGGPELLTALGEFGEHLGRAFALRDDYLGVWGDPGLTGKPAGDDLFEAKATVLLSIARQRLTGDDAELLERVGTPEFSRDDVPVLAAAMATTGVADEVESMIRASVEQAHACLAQPVFAQAGLPALREMVSAVAWRDA